MKVIVCLLTKNSLSTFQSWFDALKSQKCILTDFLIFDSNSSDGTRELLNSIGISFYSLLSQSFDHGTTRQLANTLCHDSDIIVYMTQDAILANSHALERLITAFDDPTVGAAYGRQLPRKSANPIEAHARLFNYPPESRKKTVDDIPSMGIKTAFISNSFAAYRRSALNAIGGFPDHCIVSEDTYVAAKMLLAGWKIAYCAEAQVNHSHNYSYWQEFQRYFDIGVFHARQPWVRQSFGGAEGEGGRFLRSEISFLLTNAPLFLPSAFLRTAIKYLGFRSGVLERLLPAGVKRFISMQKTFWDREAVETDDA
ncbi:MAG: glycosyltransferase family 2 protein [Desulfuromonadales bacterium]|nr:glycosyltransferase family 2 protein [Desulfuromonadales bacterium]MDW7757184.1 glycosyltransferase family 2 protein [Desulfuromonadales bacterium]